MRCTLATAIALLLTAPLAAQDPPRVYELGDVETLPAVQNVDEFAAALAARYPPALRDSAIGGTAQVSFVIRADGTVREAVAVEATRPELGPAAVEAVSVLRFTPATVGGEAVDVRVTQPVAWTADARPEAAEPAAERTPIAAALERLLDDDPELAALVAETIEDSEATDRPRLLNPRELGRTLSHEYPPFLRDAGTGGRVVARFIVDREGMPRMVRILTSSDPFFEEPTARVIRQMRFQPARLDGEPVPVWIQLPIDWSVR